MSFICQNCNHSFESESERDSHLCNVRVSTVLAAERAVQRTEAGPAAASQEVPSPLSSSMEDFDFTDALDQQGFEPPAYHDRFVWEGIDVSAAFHRFQQAALETLDREEVLDYEKHAQHVLALSSILLLKSNRTHPDLLEFLDIRTCERLRAFMLERAGITSEDIDLPIKNRLQEILEKIADDPRVWNAAGRPYPRFDASHDIKALIEGPGLNTFNRILRSVRNMVEMLPRYAIDDGPLETEYIIRCLGPLLSPLFEDIDSDIQFHWYVKRSTGRTFVSDTEREATKWLDSSALIIQDRPSGPRLGCGQVRLSHQAENQQFTGIDLIRLGQVAKKASDKDKALARFIFSVVGRKATFYILQRTQEHMYVMTEVGTIRVPQLIEEVPFFFGELASITRVMSAFRYVVNCGQHTYEHDPRT